MNNPILENRAFRFRVTKKVLEDNWQEIKRIFGQLIIYRAEFIDYGNVIEYSCFCEKFSIIEDGYIAPLYYIEVTKHEDWTTTFKFINQETKEVIEI